MTAGDQPGRRIVICRSASAVDRGSWLRDDAARPLSRRGRKQATRAGRFLRSAASERARIVSGPTLRERETAMLLAGAMGSAVANVRSSEDPITLAGLEGMVREAADERLVLVLREPMASGLVALLCDSPGVELSAGAIADLRAELPVQPGCATVRWLVTPEVLREMVTGVAQARPRVAAAT